VEPATTPRAWPAKATPSPRSICRPRRSGEPAPKFGAKFGSQLRFLVADMGLPLPFPDERFDAVMSNVALHMFPDSVTRSVFAEVRRLVRPNGLFLFHVNALEDRPLRKRWRPVARGLEQDYLLEQGGQTMHFSSERYLRDLLREWRELCLEPVEITDRQTGEPFKRVWRGVAHR
jgi:SAM-dependent methyltransferase